MINLDTERRNAETLKANTERLQNLIAELQTSTAVSFTPVSDADSAAGDGTFTTDEVNALLQARLTPEDGAADETLSGKLAEVAELVAYFQERAEKVRVQELHFFALEELQAQGYPANEDFAAIVADTSEYGIEERVNALSDVRKFFLEQAKQEAIPKALEELEPTNMMQSIKKKSILGR